MIRTGLILSITFSFCEEMIRGQNKIYQVRRKQFGSGEAKGLRPLRLLRHCYIHFTCLSMGACVQNGVTGSYMDAIWELVVNKESEIWTSLPHSFAEEG